MEITLYHGSEKIVERPMFGDGKIHNDYGRGFYCTEHLELAKEWASQTKKGGFANEYRLSFDGLSVLNLNTKPYNILNWLAVLLENRIVDVRAPLTKAAQKYVIANFLPEYKSADIIIGYRADDSYFSFSRNFLENTISLAQLQRAMHLGALGEQVFLQSEAAFSKICFERAIPADGSIYYPLRKARDHEAKEAYYRILSETFDINAPTLLDIIRQNWKNDDPRLF